MVFAVAGGGQLDTGGYQIDNSLRFNDGDSAYLSRTPGTAGNRKTYTISTWVKRSLLTSQIQPFIECFLNANQWTSISFGTDDKIQFYHVDSGTDYGYKTDMVFRDVSAWYHIVIALDTTQATAANRMILYVNGNETTFDQNYGEFPQNDNTWINSTNGHNIGKYSDQSKYFDGYMAEYNFIDGQQLTASDFGEFDDSGIWKPIQYTGSYGTNGFYLDFENSGSLGADQSGNGNNFTPTNLASTDQMLDTPTNNFATMNELDKSGMTLEEGNLKIFNNVAAHKSARGNFGMSSGKWYFECSISSVGTNQQQSFGLAKQNVTCPSLFTSNVFASVWGFTGANSYHYIYNNGSTTGATLVAVAVGDILKCAYDADSGKLWLGKNTNWFNINGGIDASANPATGTNPTMTLSETEPLVPYGHLYVNYGTWNVFNFGQEGSFAGNKTAQGNSDQNGYGDFYYAPPSGYLALCTQNLATELSPTIDDGSQYFNTVLWSGNAVAGTSITGVNFQPDWTWIKSRSTSGAQHVLVDSNRGSSKILESDTADVEYTNTNAVESFDSDGFTLGNDGYTNTTGRTYVGWNWLSNGGSTSSNTDGSITSTVQANTEAGFSIVTYTGNGTAGATIGHGLGVKPSWFVVKGRNQAGSWVNYHTSLGATKGIPLQSAIAAVTSSAYWNNAEPTSSVFTVGYDGPGNETNNSGTSFVAYCFAEIEGYSKFGSYTGNGSTDGPFVYTGFRPAFVIIKDTGSGEQWQIVDSARDTYNVVDSCLFTNSSSAEATSSTINRDFLSNGFKVRTSDGSQNASGRTYIYMTFAENPFATSTGVPVTAR